jgi:hypothetical protein
MLKRSRVSTRKVYSNHPSFFEPLALALLDEWQPRLPRRGWQLEWAIICRNLAILMEIKVRQREDRYYLIPSRDLCESLVWNNCPRLSIHHIIAGEGACSAS